MTYEESLDLYGLVPADESLPAIRQMLANEAELERCGGEREEELALLCCVQLFSRGYLEDVLRIWEAKQSGFDLACYLDVQFLCGAGLGETKKFLQQQSSSQAAKALEYLAKCEASSDFKNWSPTIQLENYQHYFGVTN